LTNGDYYIYSHGSFEKSGHLQPWVAGNIFGAIYSDKIWIGDGDRRAAWLNTAGKQVCRFETENQVLLQLTRNGKMLTVSTTGKRTWFEYDSLCNIKAATVSINKDAESAFAGYFDVIRSPLLPTGAYT
jgi:hypothetical protein